MTPLTMIPMTQLKIICYFIRQKEALDDYNLLLKNSHCQA